MCVILPPAGYPLPSVPLITSHLISSHLISSHLISMRLMAGSLPQLEEQLSTSVPRSEWRLLRKCATSPVSTVSAPRFALFTVLVPCSSLLVGWSSLCCPTQPLRFHDGEGFSSCSPLVLPRWPAASVAQYWILSLLLLIATVSCLH